MFPRLRAHQPIEVGHTQTRGRSTTVNKTDWIFSSSSFFSLSTSLLRLKFVSFLVRCVKKKLV